MMNLREKCCSGVLFVLGLILLAAGIVIVALMPMMTQKLVDQQVPLKENSFAQRTWANPPFHISMQFWIFNVTNPLEVLQRGAKPALVQKGPYGYKETQQKKQVRFLENNAISYINQKIYHFDPELSCPTCRQDDAFTIPNLPYLTIIRMIDEKASSAQGALPIKVPTNLIELGGRAAMLAIGEQMFTSNITAAELLFDGYKDKIFDLASVLMPGMAPDRMGLFYGRNNTDDGEYVIDSGAGDLNNMGKIITWQGHTDLGFKNWWNSSEANRIMGGDGTVYSPFLKRSDVLPAFVSDICRSINLTYSADIDFHGIKAFRFRLSEDSFNADLPENEGFCWPMKDPIYGPSIQKNTSDGWCLPSGMNDISRCLFNSPIVASMPQFVNAPDEVRRSVDGLYPESDKYLSFLDIEPTSGVILTGARMIQLNVLMQPQPGDVFAQNMKPVIVPLAWVNETVMIDPATRDYVYQNAVVLRESAYTAAYAAIGVGALWIVCVAVGWAVSRYNAEHQRRRFLKVSTN